MADPLGNNDNTGISGKRPAQTIEGKATEVSVEPAEGKQQSAERETEGKSSATRPALETGGGGESSDRNAAGDATPPRTSPIELKGFATHLVAGMLGALIGVVALAFAWKLLPSRTESGLSAVEARLAELEAQSQRPDPSAQAVAGLETRLKEIEGRQPEMPADLAEIPARVQKLEESLQALAKSAEAGGSVADAAAIETRLGEAEQRMESKFESTFGEPLQSLRAEVDTLKQRIEALAEAAPAPGDAAEVASLGERVTKLEQEIPHFADAVATSAQSVRAGAAALALAKLGDAVETGRPFVAELAAFKAVAPNAAAAEPLAAHAESGIATNEALQKSFAEAVDQREAPAAANDDSLLESVIQSARSAVRIRRVDAAETETGPEAAIAKAEKHLAGGEIAAAVEQVEQLPRQLREPFDPWLEQARARLAAKENLAALERDIIAPLGASGATTPQTP